MQTKHRINKERIYFFTREANKMDTKEEDILAIYIILINMVNAFANFQMDLIFSLRNYCKKEKDIPNILLFLTNDKCKVVKRKPVVRYDSISICCIISHIEQKLSQFLPSYSRLHLYSSSDSSSNRISPSVHQNPVYEPSILYYIFYTNACFYLFLSSSKSKIILTIMAKIICSD